MRRPQTARALGALVMLLMVLCQEERAAAAPPDDAEVAARIRFIEQRLDAGTAAADRWWYAWYSIYGGLAVGQAVVAIAVTDPGTRTDNVVGAVSTSLGIVPLGLSPLEARFAAGRLSAYPESTPAERRAKLRAGEAMLRSVAEEERFGRSWVAHLLGNGVALASGIVLGVGYDRPASGIFNFGAGVALTEVQILTQPTQGIDDWREYRRKDTFATKPARRRAHLSVAPSLGGVVMAGSF